MKLRLSKHIICAILALACPLIAFLATLTYQQITNRDFWNSLNDNEGTTDAVGAMMAFAEFAQLAVFTFIGSVIGVIFGVISFYLWRQARLRKKREAELFREMIV